MFPWLLGGAAGTVLGFMLFETAVATFACAVIVGFVFWAIARNHAASTRPSTRQGGGGSDSPDGGDFAWAGDGGGHASSDCSSDGGGGGGGDGGGGCD